MAGGVFVTVRIKDARICADLEYLKVGKGNYFTFFRPYHLWFLEAPISIARAHLYQESTLVPLEKPIADVMTIAKRNLSKGETLDEFGGYTFHGLLDKKGVALEENALPAGLAPGAKLLRPISKGEIITWDHVALDEDSTVVQLRRHQDSIF
jgi:predicted homoserine dehydrogenase-like protein